MSHCRDFYHFTSRLRWPFCGLKKLFESYQHINSRMMNIKPRWKLDNFSIFFTGLCYHSVVFCALYFRGLKTSVGSETTPSGKKIDILSFGSDDRRHVYPCLLYLLFENLQCSIHFSDENVKIRKIFKISKIFKTVF